MLMRSLNSAIILACCSTMRAVNESFVLPWVLETEMILPLTLPMYNYYKYRRQIRHAGYNYAPT